jgi:hypothetical protein
MSSCIHVSLSRYQYPLADIVALAVPYGKEGVLADIRKNIHVRSESYEEKGVCLKIEANPGTVTALKRRLAS